MKQRALETRRLRRAGGIAALAILGVAFALRPATAQRSAAEFVEQMMDEALQCGAAGGPAEIAPRLAQYVDIERMARTALGSPWDRLGPGERERYLRAYRNLFGRVAAKYCASGDVALEKLGSRRSGDTELVAFRVRRANGEHDLYWYVRTMPRFAVIDVATDGVLVTERQRREFETILRSHNGDLTALPAAIDRLQP